MTGFLPERAINKRRRLDLLVIGILQPAAHIVFQRAVERPALVMPEDLTARFFLHVEEVHGPADAPVIALFRFLQAHQMGVELLLVCPGRTVDALQHGIAVITAPIGSGDLHQFEGLADPARRRQVRPPAEIDPVALTIDRDDLVLGQIADQLGLVFLAHVFEMRDGVIAIPDFADERQVAIDDLGHTLFNRLEILRREGFVAGKVVIETVLDGRSDRDLCAREQLLNGLCQNMRGIVTDHFQRFGHVARDQFDTGIPVQRACQIPLLTVDFGDDGLLGQ